MTADPSEFLLARIAEDENQAKAAPVGSGRSWFAPPEWCDVPTPSREQTRHIVAWDPARVLAECEAKRRTITRFVRAEALVGKHPSANLAHDVLHGVLLDMALPYADHPDFREEWRP